MSVIPCEQNSRLKKLIDDFSEVLKTEAHKLGTHGLNEKEFYNSGLFRGAIEAFVDSTRQQWARSASLRDMC